MYMGVHAVQRAYFLALPMRKYYIDLRVYEYRDSMRNERFRATEV
jgi:hypothetical protein